MHITKMDSGKKLQSHPIVNTFLAEITLLVVTTGWLLAHALGVNGQGIIIAISIGSLLQLE